MRDIQDIIDELQKHPHFLTMDVFTLNDAVEFINDRIMDEYSESNMTDEQIEDLLITTDDLSINDKKDIKKSAEDAMYSLWNNCDIQFFPELTEVEELNKKIHRQSKLFDILT